MSAGVYIDELVDPGSSSRTRTVAITNITALCARTTSHCSMLQTELVAIQTALFTQHSQEATVLQYTNYWARL